MKLLTTMIVLSFLTACSSVPDSGYVTQDDPVRSECRDGELWVVNNSGEYNLGDKCEVLRPSL